MIPLATLALALLSAPSARADMFDGACFNEISLLCPGRTSDAAALRCLRDHDEDLMADCRRAMSAQRAKDRQAAAAVAAPADGAALPPAAATAAPLVLREARLFGALGAVFVHLAGRPEDQIVAASSGTPLAEGDTIVVGDGGSAELSLDGTTLVSISSGTELALTSLSRAETELGLGLGEIAAKIEHLADGENLRVRTPAAVAAVRGTELLVAQDSPDGAVRIGVGDEGRVEVDSGGQAVLLGPRQETSAARGRAPQSPRPLTTLRPRADAFAAVRARAEAAHKGWRPLTEAARRGERERLSGRAPRARVGVVRRRRGPSGPSRAPRARSERRRSEPR